MNQGAVASRYAKAFLELVKESGRGEEVFAQVRTLLAGASSVPGPLEPDIEKLVLLLQRNRRMDCLKQVLVDFVRLWCRDRGLLLATLRVAVPSDSLRPRLESLLEERTGFHVLMEERVDASLLGGFVLELENETLDASVRRQLDDIRRSLVQKNNRII